MFSDGGVSASNVLRRFGGGGEGGLRLSSDELRIIATTVLGGIAIFVAVFIFFTTRGNLKSPWSRRKRKNVLSPQQWRSLFTPDGKLRGRGVKFLKKVRSGGVDPSVRSEVWPFLLGVYDLDSSKEEREATRTKNRKKYEKLRRQCRRILKSSDNNIKTGESSGLGLESPDSEEIVSAWESLSSEEFRSLDEYSDDISNALLEGVASSAQKAKSNSLTFSSESSDSDSSEDAEVSSTFPSTRTSEEKEENVPDFPPKEDSSPLSVQSKLSKTEDFATWRRIIRLDAIRANDEWIAFSPTQANVPEERAKLSAQAVGLKDYEHLDPCRIYHAARLVAILEAYAVYDPEIGYCQGMSDLLSPIISVMIENHEAFWCFVGFMKKARHNFRLDEVGIRRQLSTVSKIIKCKDSHLYRHLEKLQAEDCFFVYRMVVVLFRRELTFEQTICLWEVMWADQAAIRAGIGKSAWSRIRLRVPPTEDLLLYAIAASVLQKRKLIIEKYSSMDEIIRECNSMSGHLNVWKLLDDAHDLVVNLHDKV